MFKIGDVLAKGWEDFKKNVEILIITLLLSGVIIAGVIMPLEIARIMLSENLAAMLGILLVRVVLQTLVTILFQLGFITISLKIVRGEKPKIGDLFVNRGKLLTAILASFLVGMGTFLGMLLLVVPGIIFALMTTLSMWFVVDRNMGAIEAIKASIEATRGSKTTLFLFAWVCFGLSLAAMIPCGMGFIILAPVLSVTTGHIYEALTKKEQDEAESGVVPPAPVEG